MKHPIDHNVYATLKGGRILSPKKPSEQPRASVIRAAEGDLRVKSAKRGK